MKIIAAYLLAVLGGNEAPNADAVSKILDSVGVEADAERVSKFLAEVEGKNVWDLVAEGSSKLAAAPVGGAAPAGGAASAGAAAAEEEKKEESADEESDAEMGFDLFGGGEGGDDDAY